MVCARMLTILLWIAFVKYEGEILTQLQKNVTHQGLDTFFSSQSRFPSVLSLFFFFGVISLH